MALCRGLTPNNICYSVDTECIFCKLFKNIFIQWTKIVYQHIFSPRRMSILCQHLEVEGEKRVSWTVQQRWCQNQTPFHISTPEEFSKEWKLCVFSLSQRVSSWCSSILVFSKRTSNMLCQQSELKVRQEAWTGQPIFFHFEMCLLLLNERV